MSWSLGQRVTVRAYKDGALSGGANHPAMGHPTISGVPRVGETLTAETGTMADEDGLPATFEYQWLAIDGESETELTGETSQTYVAAERVTGTRMVAVRVSFDDERGFRETLTSLPVAITAPTYGTGVVQPKEETLWSGQLTPVSTGTGTTGCDNDGGATQACSTTTILSDDEMTNREGTNDVVLIENTAGAVEDLELKFGGTGLDVRIGTDERHMALLVGSRRLPLSDARKVAAGHYVWAQTGISLAAGTPVEMKLVRKTVTATITRLRGIERHSNSPAFFQFSVKFDRFVAVDRATLATQFSGGIGTSMLVGADAVEPVGHNYVTNVNGEARTVAKEFRLYMDGGDAMNLDGDPVMVALTPRPCANGGICTSHGVRVTQSASALLGQNGKLRASIADGEGREMDGKIDFTVTLSRTTDWQIVLNYRTEVDGDTDANKRATEEHDYFGVSDGSILFAPGQTEETISIRLVDDTVEDTGEKFKVVVSGGMWINPRTPHGLEGSEIVGVLRSDDTAIGTILNHEDSDGTIPAAGPATTFDNVPDAHGGAAFTFNLAFGEEFGMSEDALRSAFTVTNGAITALERAEEYVNANWEVTVTPSGTEDVTVALNQAEDCAAALALCTEDGRAIAESVTVEVPETAAPPVSTTPLTAAFGDVPVNHAGSEFTLQLSLSEEPKSDFTYRTFAGGAGHTSVLEVTNGTVTRASRVEGNRVWQLRIQPATDADEVTVALPATTDCTATGAICTDDARALSNASSVTVPRNAPAQTTPLTVRFDGAMPTEHDGATKFTFRIAFSENLGEYSYKTLRDASLTVMQGAARLTPTKVSRVYRNAPSRVNQAWNVEVTPRSKEDISIELGSGPACGSAGAMCTEDGRALSNEISSIVLGPPGLSVADAEATEGPGATLDFVVSMSRASAHTVTVDYATGEGTASADDDYTSAAGTLTFDTGQTEKTVSIGVVNDGHDDDGETMTLALSNAQGGNAYLTDSEATGTIRNTDATPNAWLARFGRTVADQVIEAAEGRFTQGRSPGLRMSLAGYELGGSGLGEPRALGQRRADAQAQSVSEWFDDAASEERDHRLGEQSISLQDVLMSSRLSATAGSADGGFASVWAHGTRSWFDGRDGDMTITGDVKSGMLGADVTRDDTIAGLMLVLSSGEGEYYGEGEGQVESTLTGVYPYARHALNAQLSVWGAAGYGEGSLTLTPAGQDPIETDMDLMMGALGVRGMARDAPAQGGLEVAVTSDALAVRTTSERTTGLMGAEADVTRLRFGVEGTWRGLGTDGGGGVTPRLEVGVRHDGGDAERGVGAGIGAGVAWTSPASGLSGELSARGLLTHEADGFRERGLAGSVAWDPRPESDRGFTATLRQSLGAGASGGMDALFGHRTMADLAGEGTGIDDARRLELTLGYGLGVFGDRFTATPELGVGVSDTHRELRLGWRLGDAGGGPVSMELGMEGTRRESANDAGEAEHALMLRGSMRW